MSAVGGSSPDALNPSMHLRSPVISGAPPTASGTFRTRFWLCPLHDFFSDIYTVVLSQGHPLLTKVAAERGLVKARREEILPATATCPTEEEQCQLLSA